MRKRILYLYLSMIGSLISSGRLSSKVQKCSSVVICTVDAKQAVRRVCILQGAVGSRAWSGQGSRAEAEAEEARKVEEEARKVEEEAARKAEAEAARAAARSTPVSRGVVL